MRHFDAWLVRDPYSIWHYYSTGRVWQDTVRELIHDRAICSPAVPPPALRASENNKDTDTYEKEEAYTSTDIENVHLDSNTHSHDINWTTTTPQTTPLLTKLPPEIRQMIWTYVFGNSTLHLVQIKNKIKHVRCSNPTTTTNTSLTHHRHCCPQTPARWRIYDGRIPGHTDRLLYPHTHNSLPDHLSSASTPLLQTCKAIYFETRHILYKNNTIDVDDLFTFLSFANSLSPSARNSITKLTVQWMPVWTPLSGQEHKGSIYAHTHSDALWVSFWKCVSSLRGLVELRLSIDLGRFTGTIVGGGAVLVGGGMNQRLRLGVGEGWVRPLLEVRGLREFDLAVTARCDVASKGVIEGDLVRDVLRLRADLREVLMRGKEVGDEMDWEGGVPVTRKRKRVLAITAG